MDSPGYYQGLHIIRLPMKSEHLQTSYLICLYPIGPTAGWVSITNGGGIVGFSSGRDSSRSQEVSNTRLGSNIFPSGNAFIVVYTCTHA